MRDGNLASVPARPPHSITPMLDDKAGVTPAADDVLDNAEAGAAAVRGGAIRVLGYGAQIIVGIGSAALLFRHLGVEDTGRYVTVLALLAIVGGATEIGLNTIGIRELAVRDEAAKRRLMRNLLGIRVALAIAGVAVVAALAWAADYSGSMVAGTLLAGISVVAIAVQSTLAIALMVGLRLGWVTGLELVRQVLFAVGIVALVVADAGLVPLLAMQTPPAIAALFVTVWVVRRDVPLWPSFDRREWTTILRGVLPFAAATIVAALYFRAALIVLGLVSGEAETGYFGAAFRVTEVLLLVPNLLVGAAFPIFARAARDDRERLAYGVDRVFQGALLVGAAAMVALVLGAPFVIEVIAGPGFEPAADVLRIQAVGLMLSFAATTLFYVLLSVRMHRVILAAACTALGVAVGLAWLLGESEGATGAALAIVGAELAGLVLVATVLRRRHPELMPNLAAVPRVAVAVAAALSVWLIPGLPAAGAAALGLLVFVAASLALGAVPRELVDAFSRRGAASRRDAT